jgi:hypothetical protein
MEAKALSGGRSIRKRQSARPAGSGSLATASVCYKLQLMGDASVWRVHFAFSGDMP